MKRAFAVKSFTMTMMAVLLLCAMVLCGGGAKAADDEAKTIEIHPGDEWLAIYDDHYIMNGGERQEWTGEYVLTGTNIDGSSTAVPFQVILAAEYNGDNSVTFDNLTIVNSPESQKCAVSLQGNSPYLIMLAGHSRIQSGNNQAGISLEQGIVISGQGSLDVTGGEYGAGIGGSDHQDGERIRIESGTVTAQGGRLAAGIGGGRKGGGDAISIYGGTVTATGGQYGSGIGGGYCGEADYLSVYGGTVTAVGGKYGAGIGSGPSSNSSDSSSGYERYVKTGEINITGGTINAVGGMDGAGIGSGHFSDADYIRISNATITACGGSGGAGIGSGSSGTCKMLSIDHSNITAAGGEYGSGIGNKAQDLSITESVVTAVGGTKGAGIGGYCCLDGTITIDKSTVDARGGNYAAGIGGSSGQASGKITLDNSTVTAKGGDYGAGIGGGNHGDGENITINSGVVTAEGGKNAAGIGGGDYGNGRYFAINGGTVTAVGQGSADDIGGGEWTAAGNNGPLQVTGGSVNANLYKSEDPLPYNNMDKSGSPLIRYTLTLKNESGNAAADCSVQDIQIGSYAGNKDTAGTNNTSSYGIKDMKTDNDGQISLYLDHNAIQYFTTVTVVADGETYTGILYPNKSELRSGCQDGGSINAASPNTVTADALPAETVPADTAPVEDVNAADTAAEDTQNTAAEAGSEESSVQTDSTGAAVSETVETPAA